MVYEALQHIQGALNAPKGQFNKFGGYAYRSCEDILEAVKPLLVETLSTVTVADEIVQAEEKKGMDESQITGSASSYARKYALNGLFAIDDNRDADATNTGDGKPKPAQKPAAAAPYRFKNGPHAGQTPAEVWAADPDYIRYVSKMPACPAEELADLK